MRRLTYLSLWAALVLSVPAQTRSAPDPPLCRVQVTKRPAGSYQRDVVIQTRPDCPKGGRAYVRLASSIGGTLPENPPGVYTIRPGIPLKRRMLRWWWVEWLSQSGVPYRVPEEGR